MVETNQEQSLIQEEQTTSEDRKIGISEIFTNYQGEGVYSGTLMTFIRLAGCCVGKPYNAADKIHQGITLPVYTEKCTTYDGREFPCDTDYRVKFRKTIPEIMAEIPPTIKHICITGGEPCMYPWLFLFIRELQNYDTRIVHIETSGTKGIVVPGDTWVTVSPKQGVLNSALDRADEIKLLVDESFNPLKPFLVLAERKPVYLHPINFERSVNPVNMRLCIRWQRLYPVFRIGPQMHKAIEQIIGEKQL